MGIIQHRKNITGLLFVVLPVLVFFIIISDSSASAQLIATENNFFYSSEKQIPLDIVSDQLGIVAKDGVTREQLQKHLTSLNLKLVKEYPLGVFVFEFSEKRSLNEIVKISRTIVGQGQQFIAYAGFVTTTQDAKVPLIVTDEFIVQFKQGYHISTNCFV